MKKKKRCNTHVIPVSKVSDETNLDSFCIYEDKNLRVHLESEIGTDKIVSVSVSIHED